MPLHVRLDEPHHRVGRNGRVDGVAAALEHLHAGARRQRLAGGDDAEFCGDFRSACDNIHDSRYYTRRTGDPWDREGWRFEAIWRPLTATSSPRKP